MDNIGTFHITEYTIERIQGSIANTDIHWIEGEMEGAGDLILFGVVEADFISHVESVFKGEIARAGMGAPIYELFRTVEGKDTARFRFAFNGEPGIIAIFREQQRVHQRTLLATLQARSKRLQQQAHRDALRLEEAIFEGE